MKAVPSRDLGAAKGWWDAGGRKERLQLCNGIPETVAKEAYAKFYDLVDRIAAGEDVDVAEELQQCPSALVAQKVEGLLVQHIAVIFRRRNDEGR